MSRQLEGLQKNPVGYRNSKRAIGELEVFQGS